MIEVTQAVLPVFCLVLLGWLLRTLQMPGEGFWRPAERLTYNLLFPALIATTLAKAEFGGLSIAPMALAIGLAILLMTLFLVIGRWLLGEFFGESGAAFTSLYQGSVRMNTYIGLSVAAAVYGEAGLEAAAVAVGVIVPLVNVTCILILASYAPQASSSSSPSTGGRVLWLFVTNPLIIACAVGGLLNVSSIGLPPVLGPVAEILARAALPLGLLAVGAAIDLPAARRSGMAVVQASLLKLIALPLLTLGLLSLFAADGVAASVALLFNALPTAPSAYILARQLGGDATLMAGLITTQTVLAAATLPLWLGLLG